MIMKKGRDSVLIFCLFSKGCYKIPMSGNREKLSVCEISADKCKKVPSVNKFNNPNGGKKKKDDCKATRLNTKSFVIMCGIICPSHRLQDSSH